MASTGVQNYVNTVIFCVVMKIVALIVLGLILMGYVGESVVYFLITIELGIVVIIIASLANIAAYEKRIANEAKNLAKAKMTLLTCPDFHTQTQNNMCLSNYTTPDGKYTYTYIGGSNVSLADYLNKPVNEACDMMNRDMTYLDQSKGMIYRYPWTDLSTKCDVL